MRTIPACTTLLLFLSICLDLHAQQWPLKEWPASTPESQSMNADSLQAFDNAIAAGHYGYIDGMIITRHGKLVYQKMYKHDYAQIYGEKAAKKDGLNQHDPGGPYNYYNPWWHPYYHQSELQSL